MDSIVTRKKLIEVALPLETINAASVREKSIRHGHPSTLHLWWARRPLAAARAALFAQLVDDPSAWPQLFPSEEAQAQERQRLFGIIEQLVKWENTTDERVLDEARDAIRASWRRACADNKEHPRAAELFDPDRLPAFHDPFAGGGSIPLEAQRLGLESFASDLNPVAVLINKAMIEIPSKFSGRSPVAGDQAGQQALTTGHWPRATGLAEDVRYYSRWMRAEAEKRIGHLYPKVEVTAEMARARPDLERYVGRKLTVIAWLWARTVKSPNPAFADIEAPLASTFILSKKEGREAYVEPVIEDDGYHFIVKAGPPPDRARKGTKLARGAHFQCVMSGAPMTPDYIKAEGMAGRMGARMMAIVAEGDRERVYLPPTPEQEETTRRAQPEWRPDQTMNRDTSNLVSGRGYGFFTWADLFTDRQLVALTTFTDLVGEARERIQRDAVAAGLADDGVPLRDGGTGATAYAEAVGVYLGLSVSRQANRSATLNFWDTKGGKVQQVFARQALAMTWDFVESNPICNSTGNFTGQVHYLAKVLEISIPASTTSSSLQLDAQSQAISSDKLVSTDPPYYDNIGYADLSDFFYVWLRRSLRQTFPDIFATLAVPKVEELVATPYRHDGSKEKAESFFMAGMTQAMQRLAGQAHPAFPVTIYYAFKQSETKGKDVASTGWETFLDAVIRAGFVVTGTWPMRTEYTGNLKTNVNALASSIVIVCRPRPVDAPLATRSEFMDALKDELPPAVAKMQTSNIAPVDLAQTAIGPGMAIFTRYARVLHISGETVSVREALDLINQTLDETLSAQEGDFDADTRWALAWFEQMGFAEGEFGVAETLSKAKNTSVDGLVAAGILQAGAGKARLLRPLELPDDWDPQTDTRLTVWEVVHHLVRVHYQQGEEAAGVLLARLRGNTRDARELAYRLYHICERKNRAQEAFDYNALVLSWPEIARLAVRAQWAAQATLLEV